MSNTHTVLCEPTNHLSIRLLTVTTAQPHACKQASLPTPATGMVRSAPTPRRHCSATLLPARLLRFTCSRGSALGARRCSAPWARRPGLGAARRSTLPGAARRSAMLSAGRCWELATACSALPTALRCSSARRWDVHRRCSALIRKCYSLSR